MIGLLTTKELDFLTKLAELLKEYSAIISYGHCSELRILVCAGDSEDVEKYPIIFEDSFDENEIYDLLRKNRKRIEEIIEREVAENYLSRTIRPDQWQTIFTKDSKEYEMRSEA